MSSPHPADPDTRHRAADDVDGIVEAWQRERPDLDSTPMEILSRVSRLARRLDLARAQSFAAHGVEPWEFDVLSALRRAGEPYQLSPGALVQQTLVTSGTMTNRVTRLVERGLVERHQDPHDGRGVVVSLTTQGRELADEALADLLHRERELLAGLDGSERHTLASLLRRLLLPMES